MQHTFLSVEKPMERTPWAFVFALLLCATGRLFAQEGAEPPERFRESITLETSRQGSRQFANISEHSRAGRWDAAADELARVIATDGDALVAVARGRYLNVRRHANLLVATFPPEGRTAFRRQMDPLVRGLFEEGREKGNVTALQRVVRDGFASSFGDDALLILGENAFEQNEIARARMLWMKMLPAPIALSPGDSLPVPRYPDSDTDRAVILARLILCSLLEGDRDRAALELSAFAKQYPNATGTLAGRTGVLAEIVQKLLQESAGWSSPSPGERMQTFAVNSHRSGVLPDAVEVAAPIWSRTIADDPYRPRSPKSFLEQRPLSTYPVTFDEIVLISDSQQVFAYKIRTGEPAWGVGENDSAAIYPVAPEPPRPLPDAPLIGVPQYTMTVAEGRLYARMGSPVTGRSAQELRPQENHLVCLDLAEGEGKLVWRTDAGEKLSGWAFEGSPVVSNGRLFVALRQGFPETQTNVACLDANTGRILWNRRVGAAVSDISDSANLVSHQLLTLGDDAVFYSTDLGGIAALEVDDGVPRWVSTYEASNPDSEEGKDPGTSGLTPCLYHAGLVIAAPNDVDELFALDSSTGARIWEQKLPGHVTQMIGIGSGRLVVAGTSLWGLDPQSGRVIWRSGLSDSSDGSYGQSLLAGEDVYWSKREEIIVVSQSTGAIRRRIPLAAMYELSGGNLALSPDALIVAAANRLTVFGGGTVPGSNPRPSVPLLDRVSRTSEGDGIR